jgi:hypothetical protein
MREKSVLFSQYVYHKVRTKSIENGGDIWRGISDEGSEGETNETIKWVLGGTHDISKGN